jgi:hypothetical protein
MLPQLYPPHVDTLDPSHAPRLGVVPSEPHTQHSRTLSPLLQRPRSQLRNQLLLLRSLSSVRPRPRCGSRKNSTERTLKHTDSRLEGGGE